MVWFKYVIEAMACLWALGILAYFAWDIFTEEW